MTIRDVISFNLNCVLVCILQAIREILLLGHRQAFAWVDDWYNMTIQDVREYEREMQAKTNIKVTYSGYMARCDDEIEAIFM